MRRVHADLLLLLAAAIWGVAFVFQKTAMAHIGPNTFIAARGFLAALTLLPFVAVETRAAACPMPRRAMQFAMMAGCTFFTGAVFQQYGLITATVSNTGFLTALYVIVVPFIAWAWTGRAPGAIVWGAVALSFAGTWLLGGGTLSGFNRGDALVAICAIFWALHMNVVSRASKHDRPVTFTAIQFLVVGAFGLLATIATETPTLAALAAALPAIAFVGILSSALTFTLLAVAMRHTSATEATIIVSSETVVAAAAGAILLGERLSLIAWTGAALILVAILIVQLAAARPPSEEARS